jgi:hypothetical protein
MTTLQKIVAKAKAIKKAHPRKYTKWTDYIKAASKEVKPVAKKKIVKGLDSVRRSGSKTQVNYTNHSRTAVKKTVKQAKLFGIGSVTADLKSKLVKMEKELKTLQAEQKTIPAIKKVISKLKRAIK